MLEEIVRNALTAQIKQAEYILEILHERERKALICFSALERQEEKLSAEKAEIVKQRVALYEQYDYREDFYHAFLAGIFTGAGYMVDSNKEHGKGRSDVVVYDSINTVHSGVAGSKWSGGRKRPSV